MPTYGALDRQAPDYIYQLLVKHTAAHCLCSQAQNLLAVLCTRRKTRVRAFQSVAPRLWNSLLQIRLAVKSLKKTVKTFLFNQAYH